jgi:hypothetical protein
MFTTQETEWGEGGDGEVFTAQKFPFGGGGGVDILRWGEGGCSKHLRKIINDILTVEKYYARCF